MATADTAKLIALLELKDQFSRPLGNAERQLGGFERKLQTFGRGASTAVGNIAKIGAVGAVAGVGLLVVNVKKGVDALNELENVTVATQTVLKSTNSVSGQTAQGIRDMSEEYENLNSTIDDKVIQSGANMLLTFTNIRDQAFEPALEAALNLNEAMGGGEEGLQGNIIKVGKALQDPVRGVTALRKAGVQLSDAQVDQIKLLVEQNDLYGAQQIILDELTTQFGGRFAAAGKTAEGQQAALADRIEDVQKALAGPLLPAIDRVREKLIAFLGSNTVLEGAERLGGAIAGLFTDANLDRGVGMLEDAIASLQSGDFSGISSNIGTVVSSVASLPWQSIGDAAKLLGTGAKAMLDAFLGLPSWVQTAVLTGWGLNKLTGGALGGIVGELGKGLIKGILNLNAGVVNVNAKTVNGGGNGTGTGGKGKLPALLGLAALPLVLSGSNNVSAEEGAARQKVEKGEMTQEEFDRLFNHGALSQSVEDVESLTQQQRSNIMNLVDAQRGTAGAVQNVASATNNLGPRIDRVANTPHNVTANMSNNINIGISVGVSLIQQQLYRARTLSNSGGFI